jgi:phenylalanine-4-hydroxylase
MKPTEQIYQNYTPEDFQVWETLFNRQLGVLHGKVSDEYLTSLNEIGFNYYMIPDFKITNAVLKGKTGWQLITVPAISPADEFFELLAQKKFTATCWLRRMDQLDYLEEPDMFHDVFAHAPLLCNVDYSKFFESIGKLAVKYKKEPGALVKLQRLYWFTIEFGLIKESGKIKVFGAGIISSKGETEHALGNASKKNNFNLEKIFKHEFRTDVFQEEYYVIDSFQQLVESLADVEKELERTVINIVHDKDTGV